MHPYLYCVYCVLANTANLPVQWQHTKPAQLNGETDTKMPASRTKGKCAGNTPSTLIFAPGLRYNINRGLCSEFSAVQKTRPAELYNPD